MALECILSTIRDFRTDLCLQQLQQHPKCINESDCNGTTPVILAARLNNEAAVNLLLSYGADPAVHECQEVGGNTPLHYATKHKNESMISLLLSHGASPNDQNQTGQTPLHIAARIGCAGAVEQLLNKGADPSIVDISGFDAAYWADHCKNGDVCKLLPPPHFLASKDLALFQLLTMDQLGLQLKSQPKKKEKGKKKK